MKNKSTAVLLSLTGGLGLHRFYLGQYGLGILCILTMPISMFVAPLIGIGWLLNSQESFDNKFNKQRIQKAKMNVEKEQLDVQKEQIKLQKEMIEALTKQVN